MKQPLKNTIYIIQLLIMSLLMLMHSERSFGQYQWQSIGPWGGDRHFIAMHPTDSLTLYVGGAGGFIHKTTDGGDHWQGLANDNLLGSTSVEAIVIDPDNPSIILCNAAPLGMYKSYDAGATWQQTNTGLPVINATSLVINPINTQIVYAGMSVSQALIPFGGVYVSTDFGNSWTVMSDSLGLTTITRLAIDTTGRLYAATFGKGLYYYNTDSSRWYSISVGLDTLVTTIAIHPANPDTLIAGTYQKWLYQSTDRGITWNVLPKPATMGTDTPALCWSVVFDPQNPSAIWTYLATPHELPFYPDSGLNEGNGLFFSFNSGNTWNTRFNFGFTQLLIDPKSALTNDIYPDRSSVMYFTGGGSVAVMKSTDGGVIINDIVKGINGTYINYVEVDDYGRVFTGAEKDFEISRNNGDTWNKITFFSPSNPVQFAGYKWDIKVDPQDSSILYCTTGEYYWYLNGGKGLFRADLAVDSGAVVPGTSGSGVWRVDCGQTCDTLYIATQSQGVWQSNNYGNSWTKYQSGLDELSVTSFYVSPGNGLKYCITRQDSGTTWYSADTLEQGGFYYWNKTFQLWEKRINGMGGSRAIADMEVDKNNENIIYIATFSHGIYKTTDGGNNWIKINPPDFEKVYSLAIDPTNSGHLFVGTMLNGVYATFDGGQTWQSLNGNGLTNVLINSIAVNPNNPNEVYAGTLGGSVFKTTLPTGIRETPDTDDLVKIFPNPFHNTVSFDLPKHNCQIKFFDALGNIVFEKTLNAKHNTLNLNLPGGIYFYQIQDKMKRIGNGKIIIQ